MQKITSPYRYDFVGSFLRPENLKQARKDYKAGKISKEQLTAVEDDVIRELVAKQKKAGYHIITDGEYRREYWHLDFMWGFEGVGHEQTGAGRTVQRRAGIAGGYLSDRKGQGSTASVCHLFSVSETVRGR